MEEYSPLYRALKNHLILGSICKHLKVADLKECRLVCSTWNQIFTDTIIESSIVCVNNLWDKDRAWDKNIVRFSANFPDDALSSIQFRNYRIQGRWEFSELERFVVTRKHNIKELSLVDICVMDKDTMLEEYDIGKWQRMDISVLKIYSDCSLKYIMHFPFTTFIVPLNVVRNVVWMKLEDVIVDFNERISPEVFEGEKLILKVHGQPLSPDSILDINEYLQVNNLRLLKLCDNENEGFGAITKVRFDLSQCFRLKYLSLNLAELLGWNNKLILKRLSIQKLHAPLNLSSLPATVENLTVVETEILQYRSRESFPCIKSLETRDTALVANFPNLLRLIPRFKNGHLINLSPSVRTVVIQNTENFTVGRTYNIEKLVFLEGMLPQGGWRTAEEMINIFNPKTVVIDAQYVCSSNIRESCGVVYNEEPFHDLVRIVGNQMNKGGILVIKKALCVDKLWNDVTEGCSPAPLAYLCDSADRHAEYQLYENGRGKAIDKEEFEKWVKSY